MAAVNDAVNCEVIGLELEVAAAGAVWLSEEIFAVEALETGAVFSSDFAWTTLWEF